SACGFFFSSRRRHTRLQGDWSSDVCSSDLPAAVEENPVARAAHDEFGGGRVGRREELRRRDVNEDGTVQGCADDLQRLERVRVRSEERRVGKECRCGWWRWW